MGVDTVTAPVSDWRDAFRSCMTRVTFRLVLTRPMLEFLCATAADVRWDRRAFGGLTYPDNWIATEHALAKRGLVVRKPPQAIEKAKRKKDAILSFWPWMLTPAGESVVQMLKVGGLYLEPHEAVEKMSKRRGRL